jgi:NTE family protein
VQASAAVPGVTAPLTRADGSQLVDGGLSSLVPVCAARALGAKAVVAVDIYCHSPRAVGRGARAIAGRALQGQNCPLAEPEMAGPHGLLTSAHASVACGQPMRAARRRLD